MELKVTVDLFSGRENISFMLDGDQAASLAKRMKFGVEVKTKLETIETQPDHLGFRGFRIEQISTRKAKSIPVSASFHGNIAIADTKLLRTEGLGDLEDFLIKKAVATKIAKGIDNFPAMLRKEIELSRELFKDWETKILGPLVSIPKLITPCTCGPIYEPAWWNDGGQKQLNNNCYNYACNYRSDTFAQPGRAAGAMYTSLSACNVAAGQRSAKMGAVSDCLIDSPAANNKCPAQGHLVALVIWPNVDFHWYRKDVSGWWSHKPGSTQVTNRDNASNFISDPRTANRGGYTQFCTFMNVMHGHIKIK